MTADPDERSLRVPGPELHFLINRFGLHYSEVTASNLLKTDLQGNISGESRWPFNPAGFGAGQDVFDALVRRLDRIDTSYRS